MSTTTLTTHPSGEATARPTVAAKARPATLVKGAALGIGLAVLATTVV